MKKLCHEACDEIKETYDLTFKGAIKEHSCVTVPSTIFAFSICAWIKFPAYKKEYFKKEYGVLGYKAIEFPIWQMPACLYYMPRKEYLHWCLNTITQKIQSQRTR